MRKALMIPENLHTLLKVRAAKEKKSIKQILIEIISRYLCMILLVSCASTYTKIDAVNLARYNHDQKIDLDLSMKVVMERFGSPSQVSEGYYNEDAIIFTYYRNIACDTIYCFVYFNKDKRVIRHVNFRQEYTTFVSNKE